jgi:two-component system response regulator RegA
MSDFDTQQILLVDDDDAFLSVLERAMKRRGFSVFTAKSADTALAIARQTSPDKAVIDLKMEESSGLNLIEPLKQINPQMAIVILTGYSSIATAVEAIKLGATNYLCKPANTDEILNAFSNTEGNPAALIPSDPPSVERIEWEHIQKVLKENAGNISATARSLGMHRRTLQRKLNKRPVKH